MVWGKDLMKYRRVRLDGGTYAALVAFRPIVEHVVEQGEHMDIDAVVGLAVRMGLDTMLRDLIGASDTQTLLKTVQRLATENPAVVYAFVLGRLRAGNLEFGQFVEAWRQIIGKSGAEPEQEP